MSQIAALPKEYAIDQDVDDAITTVLNGADDVIACLDANRIINLRELLETTGVPHECLFQGQLAAEAAEVAPWLVQLKRGDKLLRQLVASAGPKLANRFAFREAEAGIFIHSDMTLAALRQHFRRFMRVATADGRAYLFRFWEPSIAAAYFPGINDRPDLINRWFKSREGGTITQIIAPLPNAERPQFLCLTPQGLPVDAHPPAGQFKLTQGDVARFQEVRLTRDIAKMATRLADTFPQAACKIKDLTMADFTRNGVTRMMQFGFVQQSMLFTLLAWDLHYGPRFETRDPQGHLARILTDDTPPPERFAQLKARMAQIG